MTLRRECAHSALATALADITVSRAGGGHQPLRVWHEPPGRRAQQEQHHIWQLCVYVTLRAIYSVNKIYCYKKKLVFGLGEI